MAKKKKQVEQVLKFDTIRPFGPTIMRGRMPDFITKMLDDKATEMLTDKKLSKEFDHSGNLAGNVEKEVRFPQDWMNTEEFMPMVQLIGEMVKNYISILFIYMRVNYLVYVIYECHQVYQQSMQKKITIQL